MFLIHILEEDYFFSPPEKSENTEFLLVVISTTLVTNSSFLRCGQVDLFSPFSPSLLYFKTGGRENCEPSPYISKMREHLFLCRHWSQLLGTTLCAGPQPSLLSLKLWTKKTKMHLILQMCVGGSYSRAFY